MTGMFRLRFDDRIVHETCIQAMRHTLSSTDCVCVMRQATGQQQKRKQKRFKEDGTNKANTDKSKGTQDKRQAAQV